MHHVCSEIQGKDDDGMNTYLATLWNENAGHIYFYIPLCSTLFGITRGKSDYLRRCLRQCCAPNMLPKKSGLSVNCQIIFKYFPQSLDIIIPT